MESDLEALIVADDGGLGTATMRYFTTPLRFRDAQAVCERRGGFPDPDATRSVSDSHLKIIISMPVNGVEF
jgi:hypothetical protein